MLLSFDAGITSSTPIAAVDSSKFTLLIDSVRTPGLEVTRAEGTLRSIRVKYPWRAQLNYILNLAEGAVTDIYNVKSKASSFAYSLDAADNYANVSLKINVPDSSAYLVEMMRDQKVIRTEKVPPSGRVDFLNYPVGRYRFRIVYDENNNTQWDTGSIKEKRQPEFIWEYAKDITLRPNWDIEEVITVPARK